jgi:DNA polymerase-3 subunit beta
MSKIIFKIAPLKNALNSCSSLMSNKVLQNFSGSVLLDVNKERILFKATDSKIYLSHEMKKEEYTYSGEDFSIVLIGRKIYEVLSKIDSGNIAIEFKKNNSAVLTSNGIKITLSTADSNMFLGFPEIKNPSSFSIPSEVLYYMYKKTSYSASKAESTSILTGLNHEIKDNVFRIIGCDRQRVAIQAFNLENIDDTFSLTVPTDLIDEVKKNLDEGPVNVTFDESYICYASGQNTFYSRIFDGTYPDVLRLIPPNFSGEMKLNTKSFKDALSRSSLFHDSDSHLTYFVMQPSLKKITLFSTKNALGQLKEDIASPESKGEDIILAINTKYIQDTINQITSEYMYLKYNNTTTPIAIVGDSDLDENIDIILPCRSQYMPSYEDANKSQEDSEEEAYQTKEEDLSESLENPFNQSEKATV